MAALRRAASSSIGEKMDTFLAGFRRLFVFSALLSIIAVQTVRAETFVGSNVDSRIIVALEMNEDAVQAMLPDGWSLVPFPGGPLAGANVLVIAVDRHMARDAEGQPADPSTYRGFAMASLGKDSGSDTVRVYVTRIYATPQDYDPYGNAEPASIRRMASIESSDNDPAKITEAWSISPESGGELKLNLSYVAGTPSWGSDEAFPYSNVNPEFHRIYRYDQLVDLAMSEAAGKALDGDISLESSIAELDGLFDGSERIVGVVYVPAYARKLYLP